MGKLKRLGSALSRMHTAKGFGVHSPFAFNFIKNVLDEEYGYYCYDHLQQLRLAVTERTQAVQGYKPRVISISEAAALFRVANYYNPPLFLSIGTSYGVAAASLLTVSRRSRAVIYDPAVTDNNAACELLAGYKGRITDHDKLQDAIAEYEKLLAAEGPTACRFVAINNLADSDAPAATALIDSMVQKEGVLVLRNICSSRPMTALWQRCKEQMAYGMTFTNEKMAVIILNPKLPRQDFAIWLS